MQAHLSDRADAPEYDEAEPRIFADASPADFEALRRVMRAMDTEADDLQGTVMRAYLRRCASGIRDHYDFEHDSRDGE